MIDTNEPTQIDWILHQTREHTPAPWYSLCRSWFKYIPSISGDDALLIEYAPELLAEVKRLRYLEKYAPTFQVFAQNEEDMEEEYTQHGSLKECEEYIAALKDGWVGSIEVIEYYVPTNNPQVKTLEEWRNEE